MRCSVPVRKRMPVVACAGLQVTSKGTAGIRTELKVPEAMWADQISRRIAHSEVATLLRGLYSITPFADRRALCAGTSWPDQRGASSALQYQAQRRLLRLMPMLAPTRCLPFLQLKWQAEGRLASAPQGARRQPDRNPR